METGDTRQNAFDGTRFRDAISFAMSMGIPDTASQRVTFKWTTESAFADADTKGAPYDFTDSPTSSDSAADVVASLTVPVAVEFSPTRSASGDTPLGNFDITRIKITIMDTQYALITDGTLGLPDLIGIDGNTYVIDYFAPPQGLFDVTIHDIYASARDES